MNNMIKVWIEVELPDGVKEQDLQASFLVNTEDEFSLKVIRHRVIHTMPIISESKLAEPISQHIKEYKSALEKNFGLEKAARNHLNEKK